MTFPRSVILLWESALETGTTRPERGAARHGYAVAWSGGAALVSRKRSRSRLLERFRRSLSVAEFNRNRSSSARASVQRRANFGDGRRNIRSASGIVAPAPGVSRRVSQALPGRCRLCRPAKDGYLRLRHPPHRLVTTFGGSHSARLTNWELGRSLGSMESLVVSRRHDDFAARCVGWMAGKAIWWQKMDACGE